MAVVVNDLRVTISNASTLTGWTGASEVSTAIFVEGGTSVATSLNIATGQIFFQEGAATSLVGKLTYVYTFNNAIQDSFDAPDPPNGLYLTDGTNAISFKMAGGNKRVFNHLDGPTEWQCLVLDSDEITNMNNAGLTTVRSGSVAALSVANITGIGADFTTLSKALGGGVNVGVDVIRIGNNGIEIIGGTTGDRGNFLQVVLEDRSTNAFKAHGIIRELTTDVYGVQGPLNFGNNNALEDTWFDSSGVVVAFENRNIADGKYFIKVTSSAGNSTNFFLSNSTITTAGPTVFCDFGSPDIDTLNITGTTFSNIGKTAAANSGQIAFATDAAGQNHIVSGNTFSGCGRVFPGSTNFNNNVISNSVDSQGSLELNSTNGTNLQSISFNSAGLGHAIIITEPGTYNFSDFEFNGFGANGTTDSAVFNNSGGLATINILTGDVPTVLNSAGSTTNIVAQATLTITNIVAGSELRIFSTANQLELDGIETVSGGLASPRINNSGSGYNVGDLLTLNGGIVTPTGSPAVVQVTSVGGSGEILNVTINSPGDYFDEPTSPIPATGGTGTGATFSGRFLGTFQFNYNAGNAEEITLVVFHLRWNPFRINFDLSGNDQSILVQQIGDRVSQASIPDTF